MKSDETESSEESSYRHESELEPEKETADKTAATNESLLIRQRRLLQSAVDFADHIRFKFPLWIRLTTMFSMITVSSAFIYFVYLLIFEISEPPGVSPANFQIGLVSVAAASFVGFVALAIAGYAAEAYSKRVAYWCQHLVETPVGEPES